MASIKVKGPVMNYRAIIPIILLPLAALIAAPVVHADSTGELTYISDLASVGVTNTHGAQAMVNNGNAICRELRAGMSPSYEASTIYNGTNGWSANDLTQVQSNRMVTFAMQDLC
jgi:hypothetical protein